MTAVQKLPQLEQDIIFKTYFMGMDSTEIGRQLSLPPPTVRIKRMRANNKLRKLLSKGERENEKAY
jgi:RNA polymerase sigma-70 factor (ECF subfamily)